MKHQILFIRRDGAKAPPRLDVWWLRLVCLVFLMMAGAPKLWADTSYEKAKSYVHLWQEAVTISRPYIDFQYPAYDENGKEDAMREIKIFAYTYEKSGNKSVSNKFQVAYMYRCYDKLQCYNTWLGRITVLKMQKEGKLRIVTLRFFPSKGALQKKLITGFQFQGIWDIDDDKKGDPVQTVELPFNAGYKVYEAPAVDINRGTLQRTAPGEVTYKSNGMKGSQNGFVPLFTFNSQDLDNKYGVMNSANTQTFALKNITSNRNSYTVKLRTEWNRNVLVTKGESYGATEDADRIVEQSLYSPEYTMTVPGLPYVDGLTAKYDQWTKNVTLNWTSKSDGNYTASSKDKWLVYRYKKNESESGATLVATLDYDKTSCKVAAPDYDTEYIYVVSFLKDGWENQIVSDLKSEISVKTEREMNINLSTVGDSTSIKVDWSYSAFSDKSAQFKVYVKNSKDNVWNVAYTQKHSDPLSTSGTYTLNNVTDGCAEYRFRVDLEAIGTTFSSNEETSSISGSNEVTELTASKGIYASAVKLTWNGKQIDNVATRYVISRRMLGEGGDWTNIYTVSGTASQYTYDDINVAPGLYYEYKVVSYKNCSNTPVVTRGITTDGFCQAIGTISGRVSYGTGTAVEGVKVNLLQADGDTDAKSQFYSLRVDNVGGGVRLTDSMTKKLVENNNPFAMQAWLRLDQNVMRADSSALAQPMVFDLYRNFSLYMNPVDKGNDKGKYQAVLRLPCREKNGQYFQDFETGILVEPNRYYNVTMSYDGNYNYTYCQIDEDGDTCTYSASAGKYDVKIDSEQNLITVATTFSQSAYYNFKGYLDEVRLWKKALTKDEVLATYDHLLSGDEKGLFLYWPLDEGLKNQQTAYDYSRSGGVANGNHGLIQPSNSLSTVVPSGRAFSVYGRTDTEGNYVIKGVPFSGSGTNYAIVPSMGVHSFTPQKSSRYVSQSSLNHSGVDFEDSSSFEVKGTVYYDGTNYPVEDCNFYVDGEICYKDGEPIKSDNKGEFKISVPIGDHFIQVKKQGHVFCSNGRVPADPNNVGERKTFVQPISGLVFRDSTKVVVAGRVVGGNVEAGKPLGLKQSNATIGRARIKLTAGDYWMNVIRENGTAEAATEDLVYARATDNVASRAWVGHGDADKLTTITIETDSVTGEFAALMPPLHYNVTDISIPSQPEIVFFSGGDASKPTVNADNPLVEYTDSVTTDDGKQELFAYNTKLIQTYNVDPVLTVRQRIDKENTTDAFGDATFTYATVADPKGQKIPLYTIDQETGDVDYAMDWPVFTQQRTYTFAIDAYERYTNNDDKKNPIVSRVPLQNSTVTITNQFASGQKVSVQGDTDGKFMDEQNLAENQLQLDSLGHAEYTFMAGLPNIHSPYTLGMNITYDVNGAEKSWSRNGKFKAIVLGELPTGTNFVTMGPDQVLMVLRDPPGSRSKSYFEQGVTTTQTRSYAESFITNNEVTTLTKLGYHGATFVGLGAGIIIESSATAELEVGANINLDITDSNETTTTTTTTSYISTDDSDEFVGAAGDVFIGKATNVNFGDVRSVDIRPAGLKADGTQQFEVNMQTTTSTGLEYTTNFAYTQNMVENNTIPNLEKLRNNLLQNGVGVTENLTDSVIYVSKVSPDDERYGSNNNDTDVWGSKAAKNNAYEGPSYKMLLPKKQKGADGKPLVFQDKVRWYNEQIKLWTKVLADNEKAKIEAKNNSKDYLIANYSFDGGTMIENAVETSKFHQDQTTEEFEVLAVVGTGTDFDVSGTGVDITFKTTTGTRQSFTQTSSTENAKAVGYVLQEDGGDDALSVDVYNAPDGFGPIFITKGGQTSCPYEGAYISKYYEPGTEISAATQQIEVPKLSVENDYATDVPAGGTAYYTLVMHNDSETNTDQWFQLSMVNDDSTTDGPELSIDGQSIANGRAFLVPADGELRKLLTLKQTNEAVLDYENIKLVLHSQCQGNPNTVTGVIGDTISITAHFVPACSDIRLRVSKNVVNGNASDAKLQMTVDAYDRNFRSFRGFRIQYKGERDNDWRLAQEFVNDSSLLANDKKMITGASTTYTLDMSNETLFPDQTYLVRAVTMCQYGVAGEINNESDEIEVVKDVAAPRLLGNPSPANGVLTADGEVAVTFNEDIKASRLIKTQNFKVTGKLNGYKVDHDVALALTSGDGAQTEAAIDLAQRSFAFNMWLKPTGGGELLSHGSASQKLRLSVAADGQLVAEVGGKRVESVGKLPMDKWSFVSLSYTYDANGNCMLNGDGASGSEADVRLFTDCQVPAYEGNSPLRVGSGMDGAIHELTLWSTDRSWAEAKATMNTAKQASTPGLAGYWRMDEGTGTELTDVARSRNMHITSPSWYMETANKALQLDGSSYAAIDMTACSPLTDDDYALEMWFRAEAGKQQAEGATLFCSTDDGARLDITADGQLQLKSGDADAIPVGTDKFADNQWHHIVMNVLHDGATAICVDGETLLQYTPQQALKLQTDQLTLGALRKADTNGAADYQYSRHFNGQIDEVRLWNATLTRKLLLQQRLQRLEGTESGLVAYYPFEKVFVNASALTEVVADLADHVSGSVKKATLVGTATIGDEAPGLKAAPREENVAFHFTASERRVVIELDESPAAIEGTTLKFTLKDVRDLNDNLSSTISWTAYVQRNQLRWGERELALTKQVGESLTVDVEMDNNSSETENWIVSSLPSWLTAETESGSLKPLATGKLRLTVPASVALGRYEQTIYLTGNKGVGEPLTVTLTVTGEKPDWAVDASKYTYTMSLIGALEVDGRLSSDEADLVAAFDADGGCIGVASPKYNSRYDRHFILMTLYGNAETSGQKVSFRAWDASTGKIHPVVKTSDEVLVKGDAVYGTISSPLLLQATNAVEQTWQLGEGWQWMSFSVTPADKSVGNVFSPVAESVVMLKGHDNFAVTSGNGWTGALREIDPLQMYMLNLDAPAMLSVSGGQIDSAISPVVLNKGWNWMGYTPTYVASPTYALAAADPVTGDMVKSQHGFAIYQGYEWIGSFDAMMPGEGYMYLSQKDGKHSFSYPTAAPAKAPVMRLRGRDNESAFPTVDRNAYPNNMTVIARLTENGLPVSGAEIALFADDECRGVSEEVDGLYFITVSGEGSGQLLTAKVANGGTVSELYDKLVYSDNAMVGTLSEPYVFDLSHTTAISDVESYGVGVTPRVVKTHVTVSSAQSVLRSIVVSSASGHTVCQILNPDSHTQRVDFQPVPQGIYFITVNTADGRQATVKLTKVK